MSDIERFFERLEFETILMMTPHYQAALKELMERFVRGRKYLP